MLRRRSDAYSAESKSDRSSRDDGRYRGYSDEDFESQNSSSFLLKGKQLSSEQWNGTYCDRTSKVAAILHLTVTTVSIIYAYYCIILCHKFPIIFCEIWNVPLYIDLRPLTEFRHSGINLPNTTIFKLY